jgi:tRNA(Arg) A34 adenosine deaminase TadA
LDADVTLKLRKMDHERFIRRTIELAESAKEKGNHPFGAILVLDDEIVLESENTVVTKRNFTHHAETNLMNAFAERTGTWTAEEIKRIVLYTSTEPCAMCCGAIFWGGIKNVCYGCPCEALGDIAGDDFLVPCRSLLYKSKTEPVKVDGPILLEEAVKVHHGFWNAHS